MGVDCRISLPPNVRVDNVARVLAILLGAKHWKEDCGHGAVATWANVAVQPSIATMAQITVGEPARSFGYHFEFDGGRRGIMAYSSPANIKLFCALADFFGGIVTFSDHVGGGKQRDYVVADKSDDENCPEDGDEWHALQARMLNLAALSAREQKTAGE